MKKPVPHHISESFVFTNSDINKSNLPLVFKSFEISKWGDFNELVKIASNQNRPLNAEQSRQKWKTAFNKIKKNYKKNVNIATYSGRMAEYLDDDTGKEEYLLAFHQKEMKMLDQNESQIKERVTKKMRIRLYESIENQLNEEARFTEQSNIKESEAEERNRMALGISGILDLTNDDNKCQAGLFSDHDWKKIKDKYFSKYKVDKTDKCTKELVV